MLRRDLLKIAALTLVPLPGLTMTAATPGRITLSFLGKTLVERQIEYQLNATMTITVQGLDQAVMFDSLGLYRPCDTEPFRRHSVEPINLLPGHTLSVAWQVWDEPSIRRREASFWART